jgi:hypothetical protein
MKCLWCICCALWVMWGCSQNEVEEGALIAPLRLDKIYKNPDLTECERHDVVDQFLVSPQTIRQGQQARLIVRRQEPLKNPQFAVWSPDHQQSDYMFFSHTLGGPPFGYVGAFSVNNKGLWHVGIFDADVMLGCKQVLIEAGASNLALDSVHRRPPQSWTPAYEDFYTLFVELLFGGAKDLYTSWPQLSQLLKGNSLNFLYNYMNMDEDLGLNLAPIGIDLAVMLRGYFAFKLNLPLMDGEYRVGGDSERGSLQSWLEKTASRVDIKQLLGNGEGGEIGVYEVGLGRGSLGVGVVFVDWHGHAFVVVRWVLEDVGGLGALWVVEAKSGGKIEIYDFWRGRVIWTPKTGGGFKRFRPVVWDQGQVRNLNNSELNADSGWVPWDKDVGKLARADWYQEMDFVIEPGVIDVTAAQRRLFGRLERLLRDRVKIIDEFEMIVANDKRMGRAFVHSSMPNLDQLFLGPSFWEKYSTPARDMRVLMAMDDFLEFPNVIKLNPMRFGLENFKEIEDAILNAIKLQERLIETTHLHYMRSDGSHWTLTFADIIARMLALEVAYNPNDCPEIRWGASEGSEEMRPCLRRSPARQRREMERHRVWFRDRERPPLTFLKK